MSIWPVSLLRRWRWLEPAPGSAVNLNLHAKTNMGVIERFLPVNFKVTAAEGQTGVAIQMQ